MSDMLSQIGFSVFAGAQEPPDDDWKRDATGWTIKLSYGGDIETFDFWMGSGHNGAEPELTDVLECLSSDAELGQESFEEFCANLGYDTDSRKAYASWEACVEQSKRLQALFGADFDEFVKTEWEDLDEEG